MKQFPLLQAIHLKLLLPLLFFLIASCTELVTSEFPDYESTPVVNSILEQGKPVTVHLSYSGKIDSMQLPTIDDATIELFVDGKFAEQLESKGQGLYCASILVEPLKEYTCKVIVPREDTIVCSQMLPNRKPVFEIKHNNIAGLNEEGMNYASVTFSFTNDPSERRYYEVVIRYFSNYNHEKKAHYAWPTSISDPVILNEGLPLLLFSNEIITDSVYTMTINYWNGHYSSTNGSGYWMVLYPFVVELRSITYDYYRYQKQFYLYNAGRDANGLTSVLTALPLYSNIENASGIFAGYSVFVSDTITPEPYEN